MTSDNGNMVNGEYWFTVLLHAYWYGMKSCATISEKMQNVGCIWLLQHQILHLWCNKTPRGCFSTVEPWSSGYHGLCQLGINRGLSQLGVLKQFMMEVYPLQDGLAAVFRSFSRSGSRIVKGLLVCPDPMGPRWTGQLAKVAAGRWFCEG